MRKASLSVVSSVFVSVVLVVACSSETPAPVTPKKDGGSSGTIEPEVDARNPYPSFRDDVAPILLGSCALAACHASKDSPKGIFLRDRAQMYQELQKTSTTAVGEKFVVPNDPTNSYLVVKIEGRQNTLDAKCAGSELKNCGVEMPQMDVETPFKKPADVDTIKKWIMEGAKDN